MRNLTEYPITYDEALDALRTAQREYYSKYSEYIGSTGGISLLVVEQFIRANSEQFNEFSKQEFNKLKVKDE